MSSRRDALLRERRKSRKEDGSFVRLPKHVIESSTFRQLSAMATKVFMALLSQYNGHNNGALGLPRSQLPMYGFGKSGATVGRALKELHRKGLVMITRPGGYEAGVALYAVTTEALDVDDRHGLGPTVKASHDWKKYERTLSEKTAENESA